MKAHSKLPLPIVIVNMLGLCTTLQAQNTIFSDNYDSQTANGNAYSWGDVSHISNFSVLFASGAGVGSSQALEWTADFNGSYTGYMTSQQGYSGGNPSGNTSVNLSDYTLTFQMAIPSGARVGHMQLDLQGWSGLSYSGTMTETGAKNIDTSAVTVGTGFQTISVNLGTWAAGSTFDPTSQTYQFQWQLNGWELSGGGPVTGEQVAIDNLAVTMVAPVPEPTTLVLFGLGAAGILFSFQPRKKLA